MHINDAPDPDRTESGLSTEDLAQPTEESRSGIPAYPGEGAALSGEESEEETGEATEEETGEQTEEEEEVPQLLTTEDADGFRTRWQEIQSRFVDDPREAVHDADGLVADVMQTLAATFADHKRGLEGQWSQGGEADTEDLRKALRRYRSFFNRLLST
jgi:hypothetical protein